MKKNIAILFILIAVISFSLVIFTSDVVGQGIYNSWRPTTTNGAPSGRALHTAVWTGSEMIVWGGETYLQGPGVNTGSRYDPINDVWNPTSTINGPTPRRWHSAVWTGTEMIVWGGFSGSSLLNTGGRYNPNTDTWLPMSTINAPAPRNL